MMSPEKPKIQGKLNREQLIAAIRKAVKEEGGKTITYQKFRAVTKITSRNIFRNFHKWSEALTAAGFVFGLNHRWVTAEQLLADWGRVARKLGHVPSMKEYEDFGEYNRYTVRGRFGGTWTKVIEAFRGFAMKNQQWADVLAMPPGSDHEGHARRKKMAGRRGTRSEMLAQIQARKEDHQISGDPLYFDGVSHAPVNELGVMVLFGAMAAKLGFMVESVRSSFPDCQAKRRIGPDAWLTLRIEFEYESRNFRDHGHPPEGCDMIVCWVHNWPDCPANLKVIALSDELARLRRERLMIAF